MLSPTTNRDATIPTATMLRAATINGGLLSLVADHDLSGAALERANTVLSTLVDTLTTGLGDNNDLCDELKALFPGSDATDIDELHVNVVVLNGWLSGTFAGRAITAQPAEVIDGQQVLELGMADSNTASEHDRPGVYL